MTVPTRRSALKAIGVAALGGAALSTPAVAGSFARKDRSAPTLERVDPMIDTARDILLKVAENNNRLADWIDGVNTQERASD